MEFGSSSTCSKSLPIPLCFKLRVGVFRSCELCERKISCKILGGCITISEYDVVSRRSVVGTRHREVP